MRVIPLPDLSYYWRMTDEPNAPAGVPAFLPFSFGFEPGLQLIVQAPEPRVQEVLRRTYLEDHNIGYMQPGHALADRYGQEFLHFVRQSLGQRPRPARSVLDVGCGGCYVLRALQADGYDVAGIDPGPVTARFAAQFGIPVASGFYPFDHGFGPRDVVLSSGTLEHVPDPLAFLRAHRADLGPDGTLIVSVPDSTPSIELGDVSMILHEHISYFDEESLRNTVAQAGFEVLTVEKARYGASLYCSARPTEVAPAPIAASEDKFDCFVSLLKGSSRSFEEWLRPLLDDPNVDLAFYVPLRALPYLSMARVTSGFRLIDDDPGVHGKYFDGFPVPVEDFADLRRKPPTHMAVMSLPHAPAIERKLQAAWGGRVVTTSLQSILEGATALARRAG